MTYRQRKQRRRRHGRAQQVPGRRRRPGARWRDRRPVGGRLRAGGRRDDARPERAQARREGPGVGDLRRRRIAARLRAVGHHPQGRAVPRDAAGDAPGHRRDRGRALLRALGRGLQRDHPRRRAQPRVRQHPPGRLDDHPAAGARPLHQGSEARLRAQDPRGQARPGARGRALQALDPAPVPQRHSRTARSAGAPRSASRPPRSRSSTSTSRTSTSTRPRCSPACPRRPRSTTRSATRRRRSSGATRCCDKMADNGYIAQAEADRRPQSKLELKHGTRYTTRREPYFFDFVQEELIEKYGVGVVRRGGLRIHTTIDPKLQEAARQAIAGQLYDPGDPSSAVVSIDPANGYIRAMASSGTYKDRTFNLAAQGHRQPGSSFKTMVLTAAVRKGVDPDSTTLRLQAAQARHARLRPLVGQDLRQHLRRLDEPDARNAVLRQHRLRAADPRHRPEGGLPDRQGHGHHDQARLLPGRGPRRPAARRLAAGDGRRVRDARLGRHAQQAEGDRARWSSPTASPRTSASPSASGCSPTASPTRSRRCWSRTCRPAPAPRRTSAAPPPARPAPPTTSTTPGSWATRPHLATSVWVGYPNALVSMSATRIGAVAGGTWPARIWHDYMNVAKGDDCDSFPQPTEPVQFQPFFGKYSRTGASGTGSYDDGTGSTSAGGDDYTGYDPRVYESPPQEQPQVAAARAGRRSRRRTPARPRAGPAAARPVGRRATPRRGATVRQRPCRRNTVAVAELDLIRAIEAALRAPGRHVVRPPGDDAAVVRARPLRGDLDRHGRRRRALRARHPQPGRRGLEGAGHGAVRPRRDGRRRRRGLRRARAAAELRRGAGAGRGHGGARAAVRRDDRRRGRGAGADPERDRHGRAAGPTTTRGSSGATGRDLATWWP